MEGGVLEVGGVITSKGEGVSLSGLSCVQIVTSVPNYFASSATRRRRENVHDRYARR